MSDVEPSAEEVASALSRLLAWPDMARSSQLARFLQYIVERKLAGDTQAIKAYSIAVDVFGRPSTFDPQTDPIVRVQARRLRALLDQFYRTAGAEERVRIQLPTGRYVPEFTTVTDFDEADIELDAVASTWRDRFGDIAPSWILLALLAFGLGVVAVYTSLWGPPSPSHAAADGIQGAPIVAVMELQSLTGAPADIGSVGGLAVELVTDLDQFEAFNVQYDGITDGVDFILSGIARRDGGGLQYSAILTDVGTDTVIWNKTVAVAADSISNPDMLNLVSGELTRTLGSPRGPLHREARATLGQRPSIVGDETLYICRVLFDLYRERISSSAGERAQACYSALPESEQGRGQALAAMASLLAESVPGSAPTETAEQNRLELAQSLLDQAVAATPLSAFVWEQRARFFELIGEHNRSEAAFSSATQLNGASSDAMAARARHLALIGRLADAEPMAAMAVAATPDPPPGYLLVPALVALRDDQYRLAAEQAQSYASVDREIGSILVVMAAQGLGDQDLVASYLPRVLEVSSFRSTGILTRLRQRITDEVLLRDMRTALLWAGVPPGVLNSPF